MPLQADLDAWLTYSEDRPGQGRLCDGPFLGAISIAIDLAFDPAGGGPLDD